ncbi:MAG: protein kinase [Verrucomicrobiales bacterium]
MTALCASAQDPLARTVAEPAFVGASTAKREYSPAWPPNIVAVFRFRHRWPYCYLLMEYVDIINLRQAMRTDGFNPAEGLTLVQDVCSALQFAHERRASSTATSSRKIVDSKGRVKIADFGIAKLVGSGAPSDVTLTLRGIGPRQPALHGSPSRSGPPATSTSRPGIARLGVVLYRKC